MNTLIVITGPTAVGKTQLCLDIARHYRIPIINADSRQIYADMHIGTASPTTIQLQSVKHYFVGSLHLGSYYNASMFEQDVLRVLDNEFAGRNDHIALMTGGSMMYIDAVCNGIDDIPTIHDDVRQWMKQRLDSEGLDRLCEELRLLDPDYYDIVDKKNTRRVVHALEICHQTGKTFTSYRVSERKQRPFAIVKIALNRDRDILYDRINRRVDCMIDDGLVEEAKALLPYRHENALNTVGYKEIFDFFDGRWTLDEAIERIKGNTRRYARKQLTWFKRDPVVRWFDADDYNVIMTYISQEWSKNQTKREVR
ncbi:MAG: tRNA (adenosine(37)-N6)-dimethylallyltransferase MiaA [Prevotella sp.]|nr:tRNA (adenosine(37)-N6)-dimethylallyltransferase MiaA [Prevotella sp.]